MIVFSGIIMVTGLDRTSKEMESQISAIESAAKAGNWADAKEELNIFESRWSKTRKTWSALLDHFEMDNIDTTISRLSKYIESGDIPLSLGEASLLRQYVKHIPEKESFRLSNIL